MLADGFTNELLEGLIYRDFYGDKVRDRLLLSRLSTKRARPQLESWCDVFVWSERPNLDNGPVVSWRQPRKQKCMSISVNPLTSQSVRRR